MTAINGQVDEQVEAARKLLERLILGAGRTRQEVDGALGFTQGYMSRLLSGHFKLTYRHILQILKVLGIEPDFFFATLHGRRQAAAHLPLAAFERDLARHGVSASSSMPGAMEPSADPAELERRILSAVRSIFEQQRGTGEES